MGTKVIDKLRIQGNAAPRHAHDLRRPTAVGLDYEETSHFLIQKENGRKFQDIGAANNGNSSAATRRMDYLQRIQMANHGLTSTDHQAYSYSNQQELPNIHFLLRGKPVNGEIDFTSPELFPPRSGHFKTSAKEVYRARNKPVSDTGYHLDPNRDRLMYKDVSNADYDRVKHVPSLANSSAAASSCVFYLGPPNSAPVKSSSAPANSPGIENGSASLIRTCPPSSNVRAPRQDSGGLGLTGHPLRSPRIAFTEDDRMYTQDSYEFQLAGLINRRRSKMSRSSNRDGFGPPVVDPKLLKQCLKVQQPYNSNDGLGQKHTNQFTRKDETKVNYNNPYRNIKAKERKALSSGAVSRRYAFNSVESYIHFNKIYPQVSSKLVGDAQGHQFLPRIPQMEGFSTHCTDTVLLKMMFEMNKFGAKSVKSLSKYSDIAVEKDLDEFVVVGTSSVSSASQKSWRLNKAKSRSQNSVVINEPKKTKTSNDNENMKNEENVKEKGGDNEKMHGNKHQHNENSEREENHENTTHDESNAEQTAFITSEINKDIDNNKEENEVQDNDEAEEADQNPTADSEEIEEEDQLPSAETNDNVKANEPNEDATSMVSSSTGYPATSVNVEDYVDDNLTSARTETKQTDVVD